MGKETKEMMELARMPKTTANVISAVMAVTLPPAVFLGMGLLRGQFIMGYILGAMLNALWVARVIRESKVTEHESMDDLHLMWEAEPNYVNGVIILAIVIDSAMWLVGGWPSNLLKLITGDMWEVEI